MFNLYDELDNELYSFDEGYEMNYMDESEVYNYNNYETLYNEDGTFFLEDNSALLYFDEDSFELEQALNEAVELVLCENIEIFNEAVAVTEQNYIKASEEIMKRTQEQFNKLAMALKGDKPEKAKKELAKFSASLEKKITKIQGHINNGQWDKAVRYTLGTGDLKKIAAISAGVAAVAGGYAFSQTKAGKATGDFIGKHGGDFVVNKVGGAYGAAKGKVGDFRQNLRNKAFNKRDEKFKNMTPEEQQKYMNKQMDAASRENKIRDNVAKMNNKIGDVKNAVAGSKPVQFAGKHKTAIAAATAGLAIAGGAGASIVNFVTSKKVAQLPSVQAQIKKYLSFLIALNNKVKALAR